MGFIVPMILIVLNNAATLKIKVITLIRIPLNYNLNSYSNSKLILHFFLHYFHLFSNF